MSRNNNGVVPLGPEVKRVEQTISRTLNAPPAVVWTAWTDAAQVQQWWGPGPFTNPVCIWEAWPEGNIYVEMRAPDGTIFPMNGRMLEVKAPARLVFVSRALDASGEAIFEVMNTVTFEGVGKGTLLTIHVVVEQVPDAARHYLGGMVQGWNGSIDKLELFLG